MINSKINVFKNITKNANSTSVDAPNAFKYVVEKRLMRSCSDMPQKFTALD